MKRSLKFLFLLAGFFLLSSMAIKAQICTNVSLSFDGTDDFITLSPIPPVLSGNSNFTYESWFTITSPVTACNVNFRRLFVMSGQGSPASRFEVGECNSQLKLFWLNTVGTAIPGGVTTISGTLSSGWHHLAVVRNGATLNFYLDGITIPIYSGTLTGALNTTIFSAGHWAGGPTPMQDWQGEMDEIRLWDIARTVTQIQDFKDCTISGSSPNLIVNWTFDQTLSGVSQVVPNGNNVGTNVEDMSGNGNHGTLINFTLNGLSSNFICNLCPPIFTIDITDLGSQTASLTSICSGNGVHFCILQNGIAAQGLSGATVVWEYYDVGSPSSWLPITSNPFPNSLCFGVQTLDVSAICVNSTTGYVDRKYRAKVTKGSPTQSCTYLTSERLLRIHCPVKNLAINFAPAIPNPPKVALCEGMTYATTVSLNSTDAFIPSGIAPIGDLNIQWCIGGVPVLPLDVASIPFTGTPTFPELCFEAKVINGVCPLISTQTCIPVDKQPMCGNIDAKPKPPVLMNDPNGGQYDYLLCPGNDVELMMVNMSDFKDCDAIWQFEFPNTAPGVWNDLNGTGNSTQNTNILPELSPNPPWPTNWPIGETCIRYRIECRPLSYPLSDCLPCHSNVVQICLKSPKPDPIISAIQNPICKSGSTVISVSPYDPACSYDWYCDGLLVGNGPSINATQPSCYWVVVEDGCFIQTSNPLNLEMCEVVPIIECPVDNPCACLGVPITLIGCNSYNTCGSTGPLPLIFHWTSNTSSNTGASCQFVDTPDPNGTTYTLLVTDPNITNCGPYASSIFIKPCQ